MSDIRKRDDINFELSRSHYTTCILQLILLEDWLLYKTC